MKLILIIVVIFSVNYILNIVSDMFKVLGS